AAYGAPCWRCGKVMLPGQLLDLDHTVPRVYGGRGPRVMTHAACNRSGGARMGNALRTARRRQVWRHAMAVALGVEITADRTQTIVVTAALIAPRLIDIDMQPA